MFKVDKFEKAEELLKNNKIVEITKAGSEAGFRGNMFISKKLYDVLCNIPEVYSYESYEGRLHDVLSLFRFKVQGNKEQQPTIDFKLILHYNDVKPVEFEDGEPLVVLRAVSSALLYKKDPAIIIALPEEVDLIPEKTLKIEKIVCSNQVMEKVSQEEIRRMISQFIIKDFGDLCEDDKKIQIDEIENDRVSRLLGIYKTPEDGKVWLILEGENLTILFPEEY